MSPVSDPQFARLDHLRATQQAAWQRGQRLQVEELVSNLQPALDDSELLELIHAEIRLRTNQQEPVSAAEYLQRFPQLGLFIERLFAQHQRAGSPRPHNSTTTDTPQVTLIRPDQPPSGQDSQSAAPTKVNLPDATGRKRSIIDESTVLFEAGADDLPEPDGSNPFPAYVGDYQLLSEVARGGMGVVYRARHKTLGRLAAVKMILGAQFASEGQIKRFYSEAEAAARLDHPGIVPVFEVGHFAGQHFLAMAFVEGPSLSKTVKDSPLDPRQAALLMQQVAVAIHYAHTQGIVHRDLKPSNILMTSSGQPRVTDFGLAKRLADDSSETKTGDVMGTPSYMPPEQAQGRTDEVGVLSDVYSLGATLYCTLTGHPPFHAATTSETMRQVCESEPVSPRLLNPAIPRDLETICLKCLHKLPERRYASSQELAEDLGRFLAGESIRARPVSMRERAVKYARRHPAAVSLLAVIILSLTTISIGGIVYNGRVRAERDRAEKNFLLAMQAVDEMLSEVGDQQLAAEPRMELKRRALLAKALTLNQEFLKQKTGDSRVQFQTAEAYRRMADVFRLLEQHAESHGAYQQAIQMLTLLIHQSPTNPEYRQQLAYCWNFQGEVSRAAGRQPEALAAYDHAHQILQSLLNELPNVPAYRQDLARTLYSRGVLFRERQELTDAERNLKQAAELLVKLVEQFPENAGYRQHLARTFLNQGTVIRSLKRREEAQSAYDRAIATLRDLKDQFPDQPDYQQELAITYNNAGNLLSEYQQFDTARPMHEQARVLFQKLATDFPKVPVYRQELANTWNSLGFVNSGQDKAVDALRDWTAASTLLEGLVSEYPTVAAYQGDLGMVQGNLGLACYAQSQPKAARGHLERAVKLLRDAVTANPGNVIYRDFWRDNCRNLAEVTIVSSDHAASAEAARSLARIDPASASDHYAAACFLARCSASATLDEQIKPAERDMLSHHYADESLTALKAAFAHGFKDLHQLQKDRQSILAPLASSPDFQALMAKFALNPGKRGTSVP